MTTHFTRLLLLFAMLFTASMPAMAAFDVAEVALGVSADGAEIASDAEEHTYFVGESGAWVHNQGRCGRGFFEKIARNYRAARLNSGRQYVTRWRGTDNALDSAAILNGELTSKALVAGNRGSWLTKGPIGKFWHSMTSNLPASQFVSVTRSQRVARRFGRVHEFRVRKMDLNRAWWNPFGEAEDLVLGGTKVIGAITK